MTIISIIIPVRNRHQLTHSILSQLYSQIYQTNWRYRTYIIVVDDGSTDGTKEIVRNDFPGVCLIEGDGSLWWAGAIVKGMEYAIKNIAPDYLVWLNDDISIAEDFFANLISICTSSKYRETIVGGIVIDKAYPEWIVYSGLQGVKPITNINCFSSSEELEINVLCGNIVVVPRSIYDKIGLPDAIRLPHHGSDYEYIRRARKNGFRAILSSKLRASTDFKASDFIRYMPYWMQWYFQPNLFKRYDIIKGLASLKFSQNVWVYVNLHSNNINLDKTPVWKYVFCYLNKVLRLFAIDFLPKKYIESRINDYLVSQNPPQEIIDIVMSQRR